MQLNPLHQDLFLYEFSIKILAALATYQFVMLFFVGMVE